MVVLRFAMLGIKVGKRRGYWGKVWEAVVEKPFTTREAHKSKAGRKARRKLRSRKRLGKRGMRSHSQNGKVTPKKFGRGLLIKKKKSVGKFLPHERRKGLKETNDSDLLCQRRTIKPKNNL